MIEIVVDALLWLQILLTGTLWNTVSCENWVSAWVLSSFHRSLSPNISTLIVALRGFSNKWPILLIKMGRLPRHHIEIVFGNGHRLSSVASIATLVLELLGNWILVNEIPILGCDLHIGLSWEPALFVDAAPIIEIHFFQEKVHVVENSLGRLSKALEWLLEMDYLTALAHQKFSENQDLLSWEFQISENNWGWCIC